MHIDPLAPVLLGLVLMLCAAKLGGLVAHKLGQPAVLGELLFGVLLGNLALFGFEGFDFLRHTEAFAIFAGLGAVLLLFEVGLESSLKDLLAVGVLASAVAVIGVVVPFILGFYVSTYFLAEKSFYVHAFIGATLCATSVGITARVLKDLGQLQRAEAKIILGAAVIDDVLGLIVLAVVAGLIQSAGEGGQAELSTSAVLLTTLKALVFLAGALVLGTKWAPAFFRFGARLRTEGMLLSLSLIFCFLLAFLAHAVGLAPIVGAFAAGLIIDGTGYAKFFGENEPSIEHLIHPISRFFVPIFFVHMGLQVDLRAFMDVQVLGLGLALTVAAIVGKQACSLVVVGPRARGMKRMVIGLGMIPRGEVGLIFAVIGAGLQLGGSPVIDKPLYAAIVLMVFLTTLVTPPALKWALR